MIFPHSRFRRQITEYMILLLIVSAHAFSYPSPLNPGFRKTKFCCSAFRRYGITVILMRFHFDERKSGQLRANPKRGVGFEEVRKVFSHPYYLDQRSDLPEQYRAIGWVGEQLYTVIFEVREDEEGEYYHLVTLWRATKQEQQLYAEHS